MEIRDGLTFDDVLLVPAASSILPTETDTRTRLTREVSLGIPLISAEHEPHLPALQFQRTARSPACGCVTR